MPRVRHTNVGWAINVFGPAVPRASDKNMSRPAALKALRGTSWLYAMRVPGGFIKIGYSSNLEHRVRQLHGEIIALTPGERGQEMDLHRQLADHVHHGREYYSPTPEVMAVVNEWRTRWNLEPIAA